MSKEVRLLWNDAKPYTMSEQTRKHHRLSWRSEQFNELIDALNARNSQLHSSKKYPSKKHVPGPLIQSPPPSTPNWTVRQSIAAATILMLVYSFPVAGIGYVSIIINNK